MMGRVKTNRGSLGARGRGAATAALLAALAGSGCGTSPFELSTTAWADYRARWEAAGITDYEYEFQRTCECKDTRPARIEVRTGRVTAATYTDSGESAPSAGYPTIDELFELIDEAISAEAASMRVSYDQRLGYPTEIRIDYDLNVADDEIEIDAWGLTQL